MLIFSLIGVSTTLMMVAEAFHITLGYNIGKAWCYAIVVLPVVLYAAGCLMSNDQDLQLSMAKWLSLAFRLVIKMSGQKWTAIYNKEVQGYFFNLYF